jgi:hypothetical protein
MAERWGSPVGWGGRGEAFVAGHALAGGGGRARQRKQGKPPRSRVKPHQRGEARDWAGNSPSQRAITTQARQFPNTFTAVRPMSMS